MRVKLPNARCNYFIFRNFSSLTLFIFWVLGSPISYASLGEKEVYIKRDLSSLEGRLKTITREKYRIHEISSEGFLVKEYSIPKGLVFAISWRGISQPNLPLLLGKYFEDYQNALTKSGFHRKGGPKVIRSQNAIFVISGHMRDIRGQAYIPHLLPNGLKIQDIR